MLKNILPSIFLFAFSSVAPSAVACGIDGCLFSHPDQFASNLGRDAISSAKTNMQQSTKILQSLSQADVNAAVSHVGRLVVEGECLGCKDAIKQIAGDASVDTVEQMVTNGFILLSSVKDASAFITYDAVTKKAIVSQTKLYPSFQKGKISTLEKKIVQGQKFSANLQAICIVLHTDSSKIRSVVFAFSDFPMLKNLQTGALTTLINSGLRSGDIITATAPICKGQDSQKNHQQSATAAAMSYSFDFLPQRAGQAVVYEMVGNLIR